MNCYKFESLLQAYLDGDLDPASQEVLAEHLAQCPRCRTKKAMLVKSINILKAMPFPALSSDLTAHIMAAIDMERKWRRIWMGIGAGIAFILIAISAALYANIGPALLLLMGSINRLIFGDIPLVLSMTVGWLWQMVLVIAAVLMAIPAGILIKNATKYI